MLQYKKVYEGYEMVLLWIFWSPEISLKNIKLSFPLRTIDLTKVDFF